MQLQERDQFKVRGQLFFEVSQQFDVGLHVFQQVVGHQLFHQVGIVIQDLSPLVPGHFVLFSGGFDFDIVSQFFGQIDMASSFHGLRFLFDVTAGSPIFEVDVATVLFDPDRIFRRRGDAVRQLVRTGTHFDGRFFCDLLRCDDHFFKGLHVQLVDLRRGYFRQRCFKGAPFAGRQLGQLFGTQSVPDSGREHIQLFIQPDGFRLLGLLVIQANDQTLRRGNLSVAVDLPFFAALLPRILGFLVQDPFGFDGHGVIHPRLRTVGIEDVRRLASDWHTHGFDNIVAVVEPEAGHEPVVGLARRVAAR